MWLYQPIIRTGQTSPLRRNHGGSDLTFFSQCRGCRKRSGRRRNARAASGSGGSGASLRRRLRSLTSSASPAPPETVCFLIAHFAWPRKTNCQCSLAYPFLNYQIYATVDYFPRILTFIKSEAERLSRIHFIETQAMHHAVAALACWSGAHHASIAMCMLMVCRIARAQHARGGNAPQSVPPPPPPPDEQPPLPPPDCGSGLAPPPPPGALASSRFGAPAPPPPPCDTHRPTTSSVAAGKASSSGFGFTFGQAGSKSGGASVASGGFKFGGGMKMGGAAQGRPGGRLPNKLPLKPAVAAFQMDSDDEA